MLAEWVLDPNVVYGLLLTALLLTVFALLTPGTGVIEVLATAAWIGAVLGLYNLPLRFWAIFFLALGWLPMIGLLRRPQERRWLALTIFFLLVGAALVIQPEEGSFLAVHPLWALVASTLFTAILWWGSLKVIEALQQPKMMEVKVVGSEGVTRTMVHHEGAVYVAGELWTARSEQPIPPGTRVRVVRQEGLTLWVEPVTAPGTQFQEE